MSTLLYLTRTPTKDPLQSAGSSARCRVALAGICCQGLLPPTSLGGSLSSQECSSSRLSKVGDGLGCIFSAWSKDSELRGYNIFYTKLPESSPARPCEMRNCMEGNPGPTRMSFHPARAVGRCLPHGIYRACSKKGHSFLSHALKHSVFVNLL